MTLPLVALAAGGFSWRLPPDLARRLGSAGMRLDAWLRDGQATVVKHGPHRIVYRVALPGITFYLKHNLTPDRVTWLRQFVRPSKGRREYATASEVSVRGIPTAPPLGWAQEAGIFSRGQSFLITHSLDGAEPLHLFVRSRLPMFAPARQARLRQRLARALGQLLAQMHDAGVRHNDLHAGNVLVRLDAEERPELFLIDLNDVHLGSCLNRRQGFANLVILNHWFVLQATRAERLRFWLSYLRARPALFGGRTCTEDPQIRRFIRHLESATWRSLYRLWERRDRRCVVNNRYYRRLDGPLATGHALTQVSAELTAELLADPDAPFRRADAVRLKDSATSTVVEFSGCVAGRRVALIYKRFQVKRASTPWSSLVRKPPALRSWRMGQACYERGVPTPRPLLVLHRRRGGLLHEGYLLTEKIEDARHLHACLNHLPDLQPQEQRRWMRKNIPVVAQAVRELHRRRLAHRDLKADNILLAATASSVSSRTEAPGTALIPKTLPGVWFLDLVGATVCSRLSRQRRLQNLARLNASFHWRPELSRTDRLRFLRTYLQWGLRGKQGWKIWWQAIAQATADKLERNRRLGRMVA